MSLHRILGQGVLRARTYCVNNMLTNGDFETYVGVQDDGNSDTFNGWTLLNISDPTQRAEATATVQHGANAMKITSTLGNWLNIRQAFVVVPGQEYTFYFWTRGDGAVQGYYRVWDVTHDVAIIDSTLTGVSGAVYTRVYATFTAPVGCVSAMVIFLEPNGAGSYYVDNAWVCGGT